MRNFGQSRALRSDHSSVQESLRALPGTRCAHSISRRSAARVGKPAFLTWCGARQDVRRPRLRWSQTFAVETSARRSGSGAFSAGTLAACRCRPGRPTWRRALRPRSSHSRRRRRRLSSSRRSKTTHRRHTSSKVSRRRARRGPSSTATSHTKGSSRGGSAMTTCPGRTRSRRSSARRWP